MLAFVALPTAGWAVELKVSRAALDRTLKQQLFSGPDGGITSRATPLGSSRAVALTLMSALMIGVLKGSSFTSVIATSGLCIALVPLGISVLRMEPEPGWKQFIGWFAFIALLVAAMFYIRQQG